jgi:hypothetical protein
MKEENYRWEDDITIYIPIYSYIQQDATLLTYSMEQSPS